MKYCGFYQIHEIEDLERGEEKNFWEDFMMYDYIAVYDAKKFLEDAKKYSDYYEALTEIVDVNASHPQFITLDSDFDPIGVYDLINRYQKKIEEIKEAVKMMEEVGNEN